jgi:hypothetical protein
LNTGIDKKLQKVVLQVYFLTTKNAKNTGKQLGIFVFRVIFVVKEIIRLTTTENRINMPHSNDHMEDMEAGGSV